MRKPFYRSDLMELSELLPTRDIGEIFADEVTRLGGRVSDAFDDGARLFARAILPDVQEVQPADRVNAGVALMALGDQIRVHPYIFRQVCTNGAIMAEAVETRRVVMPTWPSEVASTTEELRQAIRACAAPAAFATGAAAMRKAVDHDVNLMLNLMPALGQISEEMRAQFLQPILERFMAERPSAFALMNAVTSVARDTRDPETRWRLEELGGGIAILASRGPGRTPGSAAAARRRKSLVSV
jgi:hypothetical protein